jgi:hypothetical protein
MPPGASSRMKRAYGCLERASSVDAAKLHLTTAQLGAVHRRIREESMRGSDNLGDGPDTCLMGCLDAMDYCVDNAGPSTFAVGCYQDYAKCTDGCDSLVRPEAEEG